MAVYEYQHEGEACELGEMFEITQSMKEDALEACPKCGGPIKRLISRTFISAPKGDSDLKSLGFTKLVKRDDGVYENVTKLDGESRYMEANKPETIPDIKRRISD